MLEQIQGRHAPSEEWLPAAGQRKVLSVAFRLGLISVLLIIGFHWYVAN